MSLDLILKSSIGILAAAFSWLAVDSIREKITDVGDTAPAFSVRTETGKTISRKDFGGKLLVLNFWATWCPPCVEETPSLSQFANTMAKEGVVVLAVSVDTSEKAYREFLKRFQPAFEVSRDPESNISASYGTFRYPETYLITPDGKVVEKVISNRDWMSAEMLDSVRKHLRK